MLLVSFPHTVSGALSGGGEECELFETESHCIFLGNIILSEPCWLHAGRRPTLASQCWYCECVPLTLCSPGNR